MWQFIKRLLGLDATAGQAGHQKTQMVHAHAKAAGAIGTDATPPPIVRLGPEGNPWNIPALDVRGVTQFLLSTSTDPQCARNSISYGQEDGRCFIDMKPPEDHAVPLHLSYRLDGLLADGALFIPAVMEHKWAIYHFNGSIYFIRSWLRQVVAIADCTIEASELRLTALRGTLLFDAMGGGDMLERMVDFLMRTHVLGLPWPAPIPADFTGDDQQAATWCMSVYGNMALIASWSSPERQIPDKPVRTYSLLHIATVRGDRGEVDRLISAGVPIGLRDPQGDPPLHWAIMRESPDMVKPLLDHGADPDQRSEDGTTPLMRAVQQGRHPHAVILLKAGAAADAKDGRGFGALHRAAEMGKADMVDLLLAHGADPLAEAAGHTPLSLALGRGEQAIAEKLRKHAKR